MIVWWAFFISFISYSLSRVVYLVWNFREFPNQTWIDFLTAFAHGLRFDLFAVFAIGLIPAAIWWVGSWTKLGVTRDQKKWGRVFLIIFLFLNSICLFSNLVEAEFSNFTGRRLTFDALFNFREIGGGNFSGMVTQYWPLAVCSFGLPILSSWVTWRFRYLGEPTEVLSKSKRWLGFGISFVLMTIGIRGGFQTKPLSFSHAQVFQNQRLNLMVLNTTFTFLKSYGKEGLAQEKLMSSEEVAQLLKSEGKKSLVEFKFDRPQNVVIFILESFSLEHMGKVNGDKGFTPFLDSLAEKGLFFTQAFANGRRSIEGISALLAGIPALMPEPYVSSAFSNNKIEGLGTVLKTKGYSTHFFHGGKNGTMFFDQFTRTAGIDHYYGESEYPNKNDHDGSWGIYDEPFLGWSIDQLNKTTLPFFATVFTLSSHHPFKVPPQYQGKFPKGPSEIHESIGYTDFALQKFFEKAEAQPWYKDTLFILTADHAFKNWRLEYNNELSMYRVPLIFFHPQMKWPKINTQRPVQHIDLPASIYDLLQIQPEKSNWLGQSIFSDRPDRPGRVVLRQDERYWMIEGDHYIQTTSNGDIQLYLVPDFGQKSPLTDPEKAKSLEKLLKAHRQYYSDGLWRNQLFR